MLSLKRLSWFLLLAAVFPAWAADVALETPFLAFRAMPSWGIVELVDKSAGMTWRSRADNFGEARLVVDGRPVRVVLRRPATSGTGNTAVFVFHPLTNAPYAAIRVAVETLPGGRSLQVSYSADPALHLESIRLFEELMAAAGDGYVVVPVREGLLVPADSGRVFTNRFDTYAYEGCHMAMFGTVREGAAALVTWSDPYPVLELSSVIRSPAPQMVIPALLLKNTARSYQIHLLGRTNYVGIAAAYRDIARSSGWLVTWKEKLKGNPERAKLFGASNVKLWSMLTRRMDEASTNQLSLRVNWTFDEAGQVAEHLRQDLKLEKVLFTMGGWIHRGYDNQHPDILPTAPECGGDAAFSECSGRVLAQGYLLCLHDNYQDIYRDSPSWNERYIQKNPSGAITRGGHWAGGFAYITCSRMAYALAQRPQNLRAVKALSNANSYFIDTTYAAGLQECFDPEHPLTRADDMRWKQVLSDYSRQVFGIFGSECGREWAIPHADFFEGLTGVSGRYYHNLDPDKVGGFVVPLFEMVYRDGIAMYGKYGYDPAKAAEYVLHHISIGRPLNYHSVPSHVYWTNAPPSATASATADRTAADPAIFCRAEGGWADGLHPFDRFLKNTHEVLSPLNELTSQVPMSMHEFLSADHKVQHTVFGNGAADVVVNMGKTPYRTLSALGGEIVLPPYGFLVESPRFVAFCSSTWNGETYAEPALFTLRSRDGRPLMVSRSVSVFHGFGPAALRIGNELRRVERESVIP